MAQTYNLDEAAQRLGVPLDEFKRRIKDDWKTLRSFRDGATLRFRASDIDELARSLGEASDPGAQLAPPGKPPMQPGSSEEFLLAPEDMTPTDDSDDIFSVAAGDSGKTKKQKSASDSDVRLEPDTGPKGPRVKKPGKSSGRIKDGGNLTEEIDLDMLAGPKSGVLRPGDSSAKLKAPKSGPNLAGPGAANKIPGPPPTDDIMGGDSSSEFELSLDTDSDSFELQLNTEPSEEIDLGSGPKARPSQSGINLGKPKDSGISLEKKKTPADTGPKAKAKKPVAPPPVDDSDDFELSLDSDSSEVETSSPLESSPLAEKTGRDDSDSEFELSLDDSGSGSALAAATDAEENKGDIFETDFSIPPVSDAESGSEVVEVESSDTDLENSDFDLALDESDIEQGDEESASQVVLLDDDSGPQEAAGKGARALAGAGAAAAAAGRKKKKVADEEEAEDEDDDASSALAGVRRKDDDEDAVPAGYAPPAKWPGWILAPLGLTFIFTFFGGVMSYELLKGMWGYHDGRTTSGGLANMIAGTLGMEPDGKK